MAQTEARQIDMEVQAAKSSEGKYLTFAFMEKGPDERFELEVVGWTKLEAKRDNSAGITGTIRLWGCEIPVRGLEVLPGRDTAAMPSTACIVVFEFSKRWKRYSGIIVRAISNVMVIAEKDPEAVAVVETKIADATGSEELQFGIVTKNEDSAPALI